MHEQVHWQMDISIYPRPHVMSSDKALRGANVWVRQAMKCINDSTSERLGHVGAGCHVMSCHRARQQPQLGEAPCKAGGMNPLDWIDKGHPVVCESWQQSR